MAAKKAGTLSRTVSIILIVLLSLSLSLFAFDVQPAKAQSGGYMIINPNGTISSSVPANITNSGNVTYTFTGNNYLLIIVNRSNIMINGRGYTLQPSGSNGFSLKDVKNVTIDGVAVTDSYYGIYLLNSSGNVLSGNKVTANSYGIVIFNSSSNNIISGNNITNNKFNGIVTYSSNYNAISGNRIAANTDNSIYLYNSSYDIVSGNNITANGQFGVWTSSSSSYNTIFGNDIATNLRGVELTYACSLNTICGNNITANSQDGIYFHNSSDNLFYHNNFVNNTQLDVASDGSPNTWDDGYPSGGNYWSNYRTTYPSAVENDSTAIWNTPYMIDTNNTDRYPLMGPFHAFSMGAWNGVTYSVDTVSNSTLSNFSFNATAKTLTFNVTGPSDTTGFCRVAIPKDFMWCDNQGQWLVLITEGSGSQLHYQLLTPNVMTDTNYTYLYFNYTHSTHTVLIKSTNAVPEFQPYMLLPLFMTITLLGAIAFKKRATKTRC